MSGLDKPFRTGATRQKRLQKQQEQQLQEQEVVAKRDLAVAQSEVSKRVLSATGQKRGRSLLIATSPTGTKGTARTLGGGGA